MWAYLTSGNKLLQRQNSKKLCQLILTDCLPTNKQTKTFAITSKQFSFARQAVENQSIIHLCQQYHKENGLGTIVFINESPQMNSTVAIHVCSLTKRILKTQLTFPSVNITPISQRHTIRLGTPEHGTSSEHRNTWNSGGTTEYP